MANFGDSLAKTFTPAYQNSFSMQFDQDLRDKESADIAKQQADADAKLLESFQGVQAQDEDRIGGIEVLSDMRTTGNLPPAARKAMTKGKLMQLESQGVKPSPEFTDWYSTAKPDELNAVMDIILEESQKDPQFGQQKLIDTISNPEAFREILSQAGTEANQTLNETPETQQTSSKSSAMMKNISSEMTKAQSDINRLQTQRNKLVEVMALNSGASNAARKAVEMRANQIDDRIKAAQSRITELDKRAYDIEMGGKRTLRKFVTDQGEKNIYEMEDGSFTDIEGQPIDVSNGMVTTIGSRPGQMTSLTTNADGSVTFEQGEAGDLTQSQQGQQKIEWDNQQVATKNFIDLSDDVIDGVLANPTKIGFTGYVARLGGELKGIVENTATLFPNTKIEASLNPDDYSWGSLAGESAEFKTNMMDLALMYVMGSPLGKGGRVSDSDVSRAIQAIGAATNDTNQIAARLSAMQKNMVNNLKNTADISEGRKKLTLDIKLRDRKPKEKPVDATPEGIDAGLWESMSPEIRQEWIDAGG